MSPLAEVFAAQFRAPDFSSVQASPADVTAAAAMIGWLSDAEERWIPVAAVNSPQPAP